MMWKCLAPRFLLPHWTRGEQYSNFSLVPWQKPGIAQVPILLFSWYWQELPEKQVLHDPQELQPVQSFFFLFSFQKVK